MTIVNTVTKNVIRRAWTDLEPKLLAFFATGLSVSLVIEAADYIGYPIKPGLAALIVSVLSSIAGYLKSSTTKTVVPAAVASPFRPVDVTAPRFIVNPVPHPVDQIIAPTNGPTPGNPA